MQFFSALTQFMASMKTTREIDLYLSKANSIDDYNRRIEELQKQGKI